MIYRLMICYHLLRRGYDWREVWAYSGHFRAYQALGWSAIYAVEDDYKRSDKWAA